MVFSPFYMESSILLLDLWLSGIGGISVGVQDCNTRWVPRLRFYSRLVNGALTKLGIVKSPVSA